MCDNGCIEALVLSNSKLPLEKQKKTHYIAPHNFKSLNETNVNTAAT